MSESRSSSGVGLLTVMFVVLKATGHYYIATWSWWWVLLPIVPFVGWLFR
jgi:hypothetical protein